MGKQALKITEECTGKWLHV